MRCRVHVTMTQNRSSGGKSVMAVSIRPLHPVFVGEVAAVDCRKPLGPAEVTAIGQGMDEYAVLVFRGQNISDEEQIAFTRHFGELESYGTPGHIRKRGEQRLGPGIADFSNLDKDGRIMSAEDRVWFFKLGDRLWHSDSSFRPVPAKYSLLSARVIPSWGDARGEQRIFRRNRTERAVRMPQPVAELEKPHPILGRHDATVLV